MNILRVLFLITTGLINISNIMACQPNSTNDILKHPAIVYTVGIYATAKLFKAITKKDFYIKLQSNTNQLQQLEESLAREFAPAMLSSFTVMEKTNTSKASGFVTAATSVACSEIDDYCNISHNIIDSVNSIPDYYCTSETIKNVSHKLISTTIYAGMGLLNIAISIGTGMLFHNITKL